MDRDGTIYDVLCVGAGFSGVTAAYTLLKQKPDINICVLEAKDRIGGRTCLQKLKCADSQGNDAEYDWEMGGMWVGRTQHDVMELLNELKIETYEQYNQGNNYMLLADGSVQAYSSNLPSIGILSTLDMGLALLRLERLIKTINPDDPYSHPDAALYDGMTVESLLQKYIWTESVRAMTTSAVRIIWGTEPSQINALYFLAYCAGAGNFMTLCEVGPGSAQESKICGGSQAVLLKMVDERIGWERIKLSTPVKAIEQTDGCVTVTSVSGKSYRAGHVILAIPPHQVQSIEFSPALPHRRLKLYKHMPTGHYIKAFATYRKAYWREKGYSGAVLETRVQGAHSIIYDATSDKGHPALVVFHTGGQATTWGDKSFLERKTDVLFALSKFFDTEEMLNPIDYQEKDWAKESYNGGCPADIVTPGVMQYYKEGLQEAHLRVEFAGTETSPVWPGYISGAVYAGKRAAKIVLAKINGLQTSS